MTLFLDPVLELLVPSLTSPAGQHLCGDTSSRRSACVWLTILHHLISEDQQ